MPLTGFELQLSSVGATEPKPRLENFIQFFNSVEIQVYYIRMPEWNVSTTTSVTKSLN